MHLLYKKKKVMELLLVFDPVYLIFHFVNFFVLSDKQPSQSQSMHIPKVQ